MSEPLSFILDHESAFKNKARLVSLYSDFRPLKYTNPDGYDANVSAWRSALANASRQKLLPGNGEMTLEAGEELESLLEYKGLGRPVALDAVVDDMLAQRDLMPLKDFIQAKTSIYGGRGWIPQLPTPWDVMAWALKQVGLLGEGSHRLSKGEYVLLSAVEEASTAILRHISSTAQTPTSLTFSLTTFNATFASLISRESNTQLTPTDTTVLLTHLTRDKQRAAFSVDPVSGATTIRFLPSSSTISTSHPPPPVTTQDTTIASLSTLAHSLKLQVTDLTQRTMALQTTARTAVKASNRTQALSALRSRKAAESTLAARRERLEQIEAILISIDDAAGQVDMVEAMKAGTAVLKGLNRKVGGVEKVEDVMEGMREEMDNVEDVGKVIAEGGREGTGVVDEGEVDEEMAALEREEADKREKRERKKKEVEEQQGLDALPEVPRVVPGVAPGDGKKDGRVPDGANGPEKESDREEQEKERRREAEVEKRLSLMSLEEEPSAPRTIDNAMDTSSLEH